MEDLNLWKKRRMPGCRPYSVKRVLKEGKRGTSSKKTCLKKKTLRRQEYARAQSRMNRSPEKFTFFWKAHSPFSQFYKASFHGVPMFNITDNDIKGYTFLHCEQWMMYNKAKLFGDEESAKKIMETTNPQQCKMLGRKVSNFNPAIWDKHNVAIITAGNRLKFSQNPDILTILMSTEGTTLVEASPFDRIYGIGLSANNPAALNRKTWRGKNLLGEMLTKLREELKDQTGRANIDEDNTSDDDTSDNETSVELKVDSR